VTTNILENQVAIVTGAGRGIGKAAALALARAGAAVVLAARSDGEISGTASEIKQQGGRALAIPTDVSELVQIDHLLVLTLRAFGKVDILVNNAATVNPLGKVWEISPRAWHQSLAVNLFGPFLCARAVLPHMLERGSGRVINVSSGAAQSNLEGASAYTASKAALERFSGTLAAEVKSSGIVVTTFRPGIVDTAMQAEMRDTPAQQFPQADRWRQWHQTGQLRPASEPAMAILWLASKFAANANGQLFSMDDEGFRRQVAADLGIKAAKARQDAF
jgi:NAD(P)-dependent dehydrogenase (short-subunit alcohol dehydrogenase family)